MKHLHHHSTEMEMRQCSLRFDQHTNNFVNLLEYFRAKELYCDATIACDGKKYAVHQVVLSTCSEFFADIFASTSCHNPVVVLQDVSRFHLESLLTYIYRGEVLVPQHEMQTFMNVAKSLYIKGLTIPNHPEKDQSSTKAVNRTWHKTFFGIKNIDAHKHTQDAHSTLEFHRSFSKLPQIQHADEITTQVRSFRHDIMTRNDDQQFKGHYRQMETLHHDRHVTNSMKRSHDYMEHPQDLSISSLPKRRVSSCEDHLNDNGQLHDNDYTRLQNEECARDNDANENQGSRLSQATESEGEKKPDLNNHTHLISQRGTFQELITADERLIKQEPEDFEYDCEGKSVNSLEDTTDVSHENSDDEELKLKIYDDDNGTPDGPLSPQRKTKSPFDQKESLVLSPRASSHNPQPQPSQLRRELLRPVAQPDIRHSQQHQQQHPFTPQSIPHPVIAIREPQAQSHPQSPPPLRELPPLVKILPKLSELMSDDENNIRPQSIMKGLPTNRSNNSHLLVSAPPTYRSQSKLQHHHFTLEIHNQQLGQVFVNGGTHLNAKSPFVFANSQGEKSNNKNNKYLDIFTSTEGPLNLSGHNRTSPPIMSNDEANSDDPFLGKILTNRKKRLRGPKSWEFLVRLLKDPTTNPALIRWENKDTGVFRLVQPSVIAQRWGRRTGKHASENLTYENFARGLRYHYATGALKPVSEKSFVYRLGPKAIKLLEDYDSAPMPFL